MKTFKVLFTAFTLLIFGLNAQAQGKKTESIKIKTSAVCNMCKATIEKGMAYEKGVQKAELDVASQMLTVQYRADKTNVETLRTAVNQLGYDADEAVANEKAYNKLDDCCKKDKGVH
ncbi:heavy-metal-associated domain-containing protein [Adhaeribacter sp. BT258]|uniref:Heavy-metal-associated domain-containing protein n=1 Tax=Adhaeribacter terrigena TaxID=2793070 RepID=A0ABS1BYH5_9BACT|nr:heavy metal-associated domain-containing protein [Adhaeribacter terrigena]MBK0402196.1 heavy-metal-associated domain-containing protein [Adhaeribacter terrigena]